MAKGRPQFSVQGMGKTVPAATWTQVVTSQRDASRRLPQAIGHRGFKAAWPENTMPAFKGVVEAGAHCIETDLHLSKDGAVVISHDASLLRTYGIDKLVRDCTLEELSKIRTVKQPSQPMPTLKQFLEWLTEPEQEHIWVLLDIKRDDDPDELIAALAKTIDQVPSKTPWNKRLLLACWNATFLEASHRLLPDYPLALTALNTTYARRFLPLPNVHFNMNYRVLAGPIGAAFLRDAHAAGRSVFAWTVNDERWMKWFARGNDPWRQNPAPLVEGVVSDDPVKFLAVCRGIEDELDGLAAGKEEDDSDDVSKAVATTTTSRRQGASIGMGEVWMGYVEAFLIYLKRRYIFGHFDDPVVAA